MDLFEVYIKLLPRLMITNGRRDGKRGGEKKTLGLSRLLFFLYARDCFFFLIFLFFFTLIKCIVRIPSLDSFL